MARLERRASVKENRQKRGRIERLRGPDRTPERGFQAALAAITEPRPPTYGRKPALDGFLVCSIEENLRRPA